MSAKPTEASGCPVAKPKGADPKEPLKTVPPQPSKAARSPGYPPVDPAKGPRTIARTEVRPTGSPTGMLFDDDDVLLDGELQTAGETMMPFQSVGEKDEEE